MSPHLIVRHLGRQEYAVTFAAMQRYTEQRDHDSADEIWCLEHPPVYTLGRAAKLEHVLNAGDIPVVHVDRGGQVTYHGPGQLVVYLLIDLKRLNLGIRQLVECIENAVIALLDCYGIQARSRRDAPGVYVDGRKIAALGLRVRKGCSYHGLSLNCSMDLSPFARINPCGYPGLEITQLKDLKIAAAPYQVSGQLLPLLTNTLGYAKIDSCETGFPTAAEKTEP